MRIIPLSSLPETSNNIIQKGLAFVCKQSGTVTVPGNRANPQGCPAPSFREGRLMGPKCADACHAGRPQAALLWSHRETSPPPEIDEVAHLEANCSIFE